MALINDPDQLIQGTEITIDPATLTLQLNEAGNLSADGVSGQALYSFLKEEWKDDSSLMKYTFPMLAITPEQFEFGNNGSKFSNWKPANDATRKLIRTAGWREYDESGTSLREYLGVITLGNVDAVSKVSGDFVKYAFSSDAGVTSLTYAGAANEAIQTFGDAANGNFDKRNDVLSVYVREQGKTYGQSTTTDIGVSSITYKVERFPLSESVDLNISTSDSDIETLAPYTGMSITYHQLPQSQTIGGVSYDFGITIDSNFGNAEQTYEFVQYQLRQTIDIDAEGDSPSQIGLLQDQLLKFVGANLETLAATNTDGGGTGVRIVNFDSADTNRIKFVDNSAVTVTFPFVTAGKLSFNPNLVNDSSAKYFLYYNDANGNLINTDNSIIVDDGNGDPITGLINGQSEISFTFDYDGNTQGGRSSGQDADVTLRAIGLETGQFVEATFTITKATGLSFPVTAALERNYLNA